MTVVDASAIVDLVVPSDAARRDFVAAQLPEPAVPWLAPDIVVYEVFAVLRRFALRGVAFNHGTALDRLRRLPLELVPTASLLATAWEVRDNLSAADALYAALALRVAEPLLTTDVRLARVAAALGVDTQAPA